MDLDAHGKLLWRYKETTAKIINQHTNRPEPPRTGPKEAKASQGDPGVLQKTSDSDSQDTSERLVQCALDLQQRTGTSNVARRIDGLIETARGKFYEYRQDELPRIWRDNYADGHVLKTYQRLQGMAADAPRSEDLDFIVENLDRALIVAGAKAGSFGENWVDGTIELLRTWENAVAESARAEKSDEASEEPRVSGDERPAKRSRVGGDETGIFSTLEPFVRPPLSREHECPRHSGWSLLRFEDYMNSSTHPRPLIFTDQMTDWPALTTRPWRSREYLLSHTFRGRRLVPVEIGRSYVDGGWGQELIPFRKFLEQYVDPPSRAGEDDTTVGYLAQHDLFQQLPRLRNDILTPDLCWADVPGHPVDPQANKSPVDHPQLNAWFGPARTITPLHTDGYHNLLCQVVGKKYVRLYPPWTDSEVIRPRGEEMGVDMGNTSELDVGVLEGWDAPGDGVDSIELDAARDDLKDLEYWECILEAGETLLIPMGWWHYVRSLSVSFSVSFWWN